MQCFAATFGLRDGRYEQIFCERTPPHEQHRAYAKDGWYFQWCGTAHIPETRIVARVNIDGR